MKAIAPFGSWKSPITSDVLIKDSIAFMDMQANEEAVFWTEMHPKEKGRCVLVRYDGKERFLLPDISVRTRVHEYGGGAFYVNAKGVIYSNDADRQLYFLGSTKNIQLTDAPPWRFADGTQEIWVGEKHGQTVENCLVQIGENRVKVIASGHDFYSSPRLSPDGKKLAFITWDFPNMQWDNSTLWIADVNDEGELSKLEIISGGKDESVCQIAWALDGKLHFVSDRTGFWNIYRYNEGKIENLCDMQAEFGMPGWVFGRPTYTFLLDGNIICAYIEKAVVRLGKIDPRTKEFKDLGQPFTNIQNLITFRDKVYFFGASPTLPTSIICYDPLTNTFTIVKQSTSVPISDEWISTAEIIEYPSLNGKKGYGFYYPPKNPDFQGPKKEKPPLIVKCHGGPTGCSFHSFSLETQYWTSRGFAFVDVNYSGSTGFGREYFKRLEKRWGIIDVEDAINAANVLVKKSFADPKKLFIRGGSAGGYTVLAAMTFHDVFAGGTSYYGVCDLEMLYKDTHKFESKYTDILVGQYPEEIELIQKRSPIHFTERITAPILLLQGSEDTIVPSNQAINIYEALKRRKIPVGMIIFEGEGHGFRQAPNIKQALDAEFYFYAKILHLNLDQLFDEPPVTIIGI